ncbi:MAG: hypothetical protein JW881_04930 [Spirochaetales bacterium]|nr:hypothetical protein [Spirochaetales bacterium]
MNIKTITPVFLILLSLLAFCCGVSGPAGIYISHLDNVMTLFEKNPEDAVAAGDAVYRYVEENKKSIEEAIAALRKLDTQETAAVAAPVIKKINEVINYIKQASSETYPLGNSQKLINALLALKVI